ncbi:MAG TPA: hypothetical protein DCE52_19435 [Rhodobacteraceae bacterium]|nr:hypothetical protein [Paracoccaceae bacterium]
MSNVQNISTVSASVRSAFDFDVDKFPLFGPDNMKTDQYGLFRSDTGYIEGVKSISGRYVPHSTDDVCALVEAASTMFDGDVTCKTHWNRGHYVSIQPTDEHRRAIHGKNDNIFPRVIIRGGFDGKGFHGTMGYFRDACSNLAMMRKVAGTCVSIRHTSGLRDRMNFLVDTFGELSEGWENLVSVATAMESKNVNLDSFLGSLFADKAPTEAEFQAADDGDKVRKVTSYNDRIEAITKRVVGERAKTGRVALEKDAPKIVSAWEMFNAVQGYYQHDAQAKKGFKSDFARILRSANERYVHQAENLLLAA